MGAELTDGAVACAEHGVETRLTCVQCRSPICPQCFVRTPVGLKCLGCGSKPGVPAPSSPPRRRGVVAVPVVVLIALASVLVLPRVMSSDAPTTSDADAVGFVADPSGPARRALLGEEALDGDFGFVVSALECGAPEVPVDTGGARAAQGQYCLMAIDVRNVGRSPATFLARSQLLVDSANRRFALDVPATMGHPRNAGTDVLQPVVNPGNQISGVLVFDVPHDVRLRSVSLRHLESGPGATVFLQPR